MRWTSIPSGVGGVEYWHSNLLHTSANGPLDSNADFSFSFPYLFICHASLLSSSLHSLKIEPKITTGYESATFYLMNTSLFRIN